MKREQIITKMKEEGLVAVVRAESREQGEKIIDAILAGGIHFIEITMTVPGAMHIIEAMAEKYKDNQEVVIGAGTVLDPETARAAILAGASYIVAPSLNLDTIRLCNRYCVPVIPGVMTPTEAVSALEAGCGLLKIFPGNVMGPGAISSFRGPLPQADYMPTGGVDVDNIDQWMKAGACAVGTGSSLTKGAKTGNYQAVTKKAEEFVAAVKAARS